MAYVRKTSSLYISDELKIVLESIKNQSFVASLLLKKRHKVEDMVDNYINFIGLSKSDKTKISYLTEDRMKNIEPGDYWSSSRRYQAKPGGIVSKLFKDIPNSEVEAFSNAFRSVGLKNSFDFKIVDGEDIRKYYNGDEYNSNGGSLGNSCMKYDRCQKYLDVYVENKGLISMLIMMNKDGALMGRSLLWNDGDKKVMDRIYTENDEMLTIFFKNWADENGYIYKKNQNWVTTQVFINKGVEEVHQLSFNIKGDYIYFPYFDTFKFYDKENRVLHNYNPGGNSIKILCSPDGEYLVHDYLLEDEIDRNYYYYSDIIRLDYCNLSVHRDKCHWSDVNDCYILREDAVFQDVIRDYIFNENFDMLNSKTIREKIENAMSRRRDTFSALCDNYITINLSGSLTGQSQF
jgi:hypothetical protein